MGKIPVALQLYSVRRDLASDFEGTLRQVKDMGYEGVEFAGLFDRSVERVKQLLDDLGLIPVSAHVPFEEMMSDPDGVLDRYAELGCSYVAIPYMTEEHRPGAPGFGEVIESIKKLGQVARDKGLTLLYHNHDFEFVKVNGVYGLDLLYSSVSPELLQTQIDTCWVNVAGVDPVEYIKNYSGRAPVVHLKDFVMKGKEKPAKMYQLIGMESDDDTQSSDESFGFRPVGYGVQDIPAILKAAEDAGARWLVVEQDEPGPGKTAMESVKMSIDYLRSLK
ncbi:MAG: sugar phosphate isomerase/epimerase [Bacillota bacterium]|nr:sugar phosphate isomerase/epimerase [Bacillota bacterium]HPZ54038.1 sugar phosphate isomerase/epimerase [Bacillota bacterium]HQD17509.1 sugar phosphate isomerase/epimerase [Bacillota bacterium]